MKKGQKGRSGEKVIKEDNAGKLKKAIWTTAGVALSVAVFCFIPDMQKKLSDVIYLKINKRGREKKK